MAPKVPPSGEIQSVPVIINSAGNVEEYTFPPLSSLSCMEAGMHQQGELTRAPVSGIDSFYRFPYGTNYAVAPFLESYYNTNNGLQFKPVSSLYFLYLDASETKTTGVPEQYKQKEKLFLDVTDQGGFSIEAKTFDYLPSEEYYTDYAVYDGDSQIYCANPDDLDEKNPFYVFIPNKFDVIEKPTDKTRVAFTSTDFAGQMPVLDNDSTNEITKVELGKWNLLLTRTLPKETQERDVVLIEGSDQKGKVISNNGAFAIVVPAGTSPDAKLTIVDRNSRTRGEATYPSTPVPPLQIRTVKIYLKGMENDPAVFRQPQALPPADARVGTYDPFQEAMLDVLPKASVIDLSANSNQEDVDNYKIFLGYMKSAYPAAMGGDTDKALAFEKNFKHLLGLNIPIDSTTYISAAQIAQTRGDITSQYQRLQWALASVDVTDEIINEQTSVTTQIEETYGFVDITGISLVTTPAAAGDQGNSLLFINEQLRTTGHYRGLAPIKEPFGDSLNYSLTAADGTTSTFTVQSVKQKGDNSYQTFGTQTTGATQPADAPATNTPPEHAPPKEGTKEKEPYTAPWTRYVNFMLGGYAAHASSGTVDVNSKNYFDPLNNPSSGWGGGGLVELSGELPLGFGSLELAASSLFGPISLTDNSDSSVGYSHVIALPALTLYTNVNMGNKWQVGGGPSFGMPVALSTPSTDTMNSAEPTITMDHLDFVPHPALGGAANISWRNHATLGLGLYSNTHQVNGQIVGSTYDSSAIGQDVIAYSYLGWNIF